MMDFSKFRASGDLSDLVVVVDGHENHLHRFPLYAKSDYFCSLLQSATTNKWRVELADFPGGQPVFCMVADFCYNMACQVKKDNVLELRCAAHLLQMNGPGNLAEMADKNLQDTIASAKLSRSSSTVLNLLLHCVSLGQLADTVGAVDTCIDALVDTWLRFTSKFSPTNPVGGPKASPGSAFTPMLSSLTLNSASPEGGLPTDDVTLRMLCQLPEKWFASLLSKAVERGLSQAHLAEMAVSYVSEAIDKEEANGPSDSVASSSIGSEVKGREMQGDSEKDLDSTLNRELPATLDLGVLVDIVLTALPEEAYSLPSHTMEWLTKVLRICTASGSSCRTFLAKIAADMLTRLPAEDLCVVSPSLLHDIVLQSKVDDKQAEHCSQLVDTYMAQMAKKGVLTSETFRLLAQAAPANVRRCHDSLYEVLEHVLTAEADSLNDEQRGELLSTINLDLVSESTLQRALSSELFSPLPIAHAALRLCSKLSLELEDVKYIAQLQEEELHKFHSRCSPQSPTQQGATITPLTKGDSDSGFSDTCRDLKQGPEAANQHLPAVQSALDTARSKVMVPVSGYSSHRSYPPSTSLYTLTTGSNLPGVEHDISLQDELEFRFDRSFRSLEPRVRSRHLPAYTGSSSSNGYHHHRSTYFPYSPRY